VSLNARVRLRRGSLDLDAPISVAGGEVLALLGPNGAGKTSTLRALAGLSALDDGIVTLDGRFLDHPASGTFVAPEHRSVGVVFQDYLLFPHLSALENVAFGLRTRGVRPREARARARGWLAAVGLDEHAKARPRELSGGQAQRVALARALAPAPRLLLLDEPLAALDASTRADVRADLRRHLSAYAGCAVVVTHDVLDAIVLADRVAVVENGRIVQAGVLAEIASAPRTDYVARLLGLNLYRGRATGTTVHLAGGGRLTVADPAYGDVFVAFPPTAVALYLSRPDGTPRNAWPAVVRAVEEYAGHARVALDGAPPVAADVTTAAVAQLGLVPGVEVWAVVKASETAAYPRG
jgi:molybdate transport system ATP-binding protein